MIRIRIMLLLFALMSSAASAQTTSGTGGVTLTTAQIMAMQGSTKPSTTLRRARPRPDRGNLPQNPDSKKYSTSRNTASVTTNATLAPMALQSTSTNFLGGTLADTGSYPPDTMGAVGPTQYLVIVNGLFRSFNKATGIADGVMSANPDIFFQSVISPAPSGGSNYTTDPRVRFDRLTGRWFIIMIDVPTLADGVTNTANRVMLAVSNGATITGSTTWTFFYFQQDQAPPSGDTGNFADYPTLGIDANALYIGAGEFTPSGSWTGSSAFVVRKSSILGSGPIVVTAFRNLTGSTSGTGPGTPQGVDNFDPGATNGYIIGSDNASYGTLILRRISNPGGTPTISDNISLTVPSTASPVPVPHKSNTRGSSGRLDSIDDRLMMAVIRNGNLWTAHNINVDDTGTAPGTSTPRNASRWYEIQNLDTTPILAQSGTVFDSTFSSPLNYWMPSIMVSGQGHVILGCSVAGTNSYVDAAYTGRLATDASGTMATPARYTASTTAYNPPGDSGGSSGRRWGDYSYTCLDPDDDMTMWTIQEYCNSTNSYGMQVVKLFAPPPANPASCNPASLPQGASGASVVVTGTAASGSGFYDPGAGFAKRLAAAVSGSGVTLNSVSYTDLTHLTLNLSVSPSAATGTRAITITNPDGQTLTSGTGILTVTVPAPVVTSSTSATGVSGSTFSYQITATNSPTAYSASGLPSSLTVSTTNGLISGTPSTSGTFGVTIGASNPGGTGTALLNLLIETPYMAWKQSVFTTAQLANPSISGDYASPAGDGISNLMKYGLHINPFINGCPKLPTGSLSTIGSGKYLTLTYTQVISATDIIYAPEVSGNLQTWRSDSGAVATVSTTDNGDGLTRTVVVQDLSPSNNNNRRFIRLKVTKP